MKLTRNKMAEQDNKVSLTADLLANFHDKSLCMEAETYIKDVLTCSDIPLHEKHQETKRWLQWARQKPHLKVITCPVPVGVLPQGIRAELHDVKVFTRHGPDDIIFDNNKDIRDKVARGNCFMEILDGKEAGCTVLVYALKKFTGGLGDDDDRESGDNFTWQRYFTKPIEEAKLVIATKKANGEAAHFSVRKIGGKYVLCGGSKNVHLMFRTKEDIERYTEPRFAVAKEVSMALLENVAAMDKSARQRLFKFMALSELTAIFEILNPTHQHVEDLSYLTKSELNFICWTSSKLEFSNNNRLCVMPPHIAIEIAQSFNLKCVQYEVLPVADVEERMNKVRQGYQYEGEVFYFLDEDSDVIGLLKKKTAWYILCRAIREKCRAAAQAAQRSPDKFSMSESIRKTELRITQIQQWLSLDEETTQAWKNLGVSFLKWMIHNLEQRNITVTDVADLYPVTWKKFLKESGQSDNISSTKNNPVSGDGS